MGASSQGSGCLPLLSARESEGRATFSTQNSLGSPRTQAGVRNSGNIHHAFDFARPAGILGAMLFPQWWRPRNGCLRPQARRGLVILVCSLCCLLACRESSAAPRKLRVHDPLKTASLLSSGGTMIADYGSFQVIEAELPGSGLPDGVESAEASHFIHLNAGPLDTRTDPGGTARRLLGNFAGQRLHLIQFAGPVRPDWRAMLEQTGVRVVSYVPQNAYLIYGDATALGRLQAWADQEKAVQWEGEFQPGFKLSPRARKAAAGGVGAETFAIQLVEDPQANAGTLALIDQLRLAPIQRQTAFLGYVNVVVALPPAVIDQLAGQPDVVSITVYATRRKLDERQSQIVAGNLSGVGPSGPGYLDWLVSKGFSQAQFAASGFVVDVTDSGVDNGTTDVGHFALRLEGDPAGLSRVVYSRLEGFPNVGSTLVGCDGHGTLNAHILAGYSALEGFPHGDSSGFSYGLGVCPFVNVGASVIFDPDLFTNPIYQDLQARAYQNNARISANSWGAEVFGEYDIDAQAYDALVRDAQPAGSAVPMPGNQEMVIVFAAGNAGPEESSISSPGSAKNVITVGASESFRSLSLAEGGNSSGGQDGCGAFDSDADNINDIAVFSGRGPCADGRSKPDLVAPGTHITGGVAQSGPATTNGVGSAAFCFNASGVCALFGGGSMGDPDNFFPLGQQFYTVSSGTSHATPAVAGACALLRQHFINHGMAPPSPAMTKAFLINTARFLDGLDAGGLWSSGQGMGAVNLGMALDDAERILRDQEASDTFTASGQTRVFTGTIADPSKSFRVTLAWTDAPGSTFGSAYNNDLDLTVTVGGQTFKGNVFDGEFSVTGGQADPRNNVESVFLPAGLSGNFAVTVTAANINSDGVPNQPPLLDQDFALVIYNARQSPVAVIVPESFAVIGENCPPANGAIDPGETVTVDVELRNVGTAATTNLVVTLLATNHVNSPGAPQDFGSIPPGGTAMRSFSFTATAGCGDVFQPVFQVQEGTLDPEFVFGTMRAGVQTLEMLHATNSMFIAIPASGSAGIASQYPSTIVVTGVTGIISKVTVTLVGLTHTFPDDLDVLLVGPQGQKIVLMSDAGGSGSISGSTVTFDDTAFSAVPDSSMLGSGTYRPANYAGKNDPFPAPAPRGPFDDTLSDMKGLDPNGTWSLYIVDDSSGDLGHVAAGWRLNLLLENSTCCAGTWPTADLATGQAVFPTLTNPAGQFSFTVTVTNLGSDTAEDVILTDTLPGALEFISAAPDRGICTNSGNHVVWLVGNLTNGEVAQLELVAEAVTPGIWVNSADATSSVLDPLTMNNTAAVGFTINAPPEISPIPDGMTFEDNLFGPVSFTVKDAESDAEDLIVTASVSDTNLFSEANVFLGGFGEMRTISLFPEPDQHGECTVTIMVSDGFATTNRSFQVTVQQVNDPPILTPVADRTIHFGTALVFTNVATDADIPADTLTFSFWSAPPGAELDPVTGVFFWAPDEAYVNSTTGFGIQVLDSGEPQLGDMLFFLVTVVPALEVQASVVSNSAIALSWTSIPGATYRVQYTESLSDGGWTDLSPDVVAGDSTASFEDAVGTTNRFYRVLLVP